MVDVKKRVQEIKAELEKGNAFGEKVLLVAATKTQSAEIINQAIQAGVDAVAENKPQEFRDKHETLLPCERHFIGHLQTNKIKYLIGKIGLYHSCDRNELAEELAKQSLKNCLVSNEGCRRRVRRHHPGRHHSVCCFPDPAELPRPERQHAG